MEEPGSADAETEGVAEWGVKEGIACGVVGAWWGG